MGLKIMIQKWPLSARGSIMQALSDYIIGVEENALAVP